MVVKLKASVAGLINKADWYRHDTADLEGVTNLPNNPAVGLEGVLIFEPTAAQVATKMVCPIVVKTVIGDIRCGIYESKNTPGTLYLTPPQSAETTAEGTTIYHDQVVMNRKLIAQVLRFIETQVDMEEEDGMDLGLDDLDLDLDL